jgi:hypothetical protein
MSETSTESAPIRAAAALRARSYCCGWKSAGSFHGWPLRATAARPASCTAMGSGL